MVKLREEGINRLEDLVSFNADNVSIIAEVLRKPIALLPTFGGTRAAPELMSSPGVQV